MTRLKIYRGGEHETPAEARSGLPSKQEVDDHV